MAFETLENCRKGVLAMKVLNRSGQEHGLHRVALVDLVGRKQTEEIQKTPFKILANIELYCEV